MNSFCTTFYCNKQFNISLSLEDVFSPFQLILYFLKACTQFGTFIPQSHRVCTLKMALGLARALLMPPEGSGCDPGDSFLLLPFLNQPHFLSLCSYPARHFLFLHILLMNDSYSLNATCLLNFSAITPINVNHCGV